MTDKNQRLVFSILEFLTTAMEDGTVKADDKEGLEIAVQCIGEAFGVDPTDTAQRERLSIKPATLPSIFDVYVKTRDKMGAGAAGTSAASKTTPPPAPKSAASSADKQAAEAFKAAGNAKMSARAYKDAITEYTKAIDLDGQNPVYYSNRAAAYSSVDEQESAIADAEKAIEIDPKFVKAYSRLGHAYYSKEEYVEAADAFERGLLIDANNANLKSGLENSKQRIPSTERSPAASAGGAGGMPDLSALAGMLGGGAGRGGGGGGMPDLGALLNNPALMSMAQNMMANGGMEQMMQNPAMQNLARNFQSGGGMPDMSTLMSDPNIANLASQFMGGAGRGGGAGGATP